MEEELFGLTWDDEIDEVDEEKKKKKDKELEHSSRPFFPWYCRELPEVDPPHFDHQLKYKEDRELYEAYLEKALPALEHFPLKTQNKKMLRANCRGRGILDTGPKEALRRRVERHILGELEPFVVSKREKLKVEPQKNRLGAALDQLPHGLLQLVLSKCETEDLLVLMRTSKYLHLDAKQVVSARAVAFFGREEATPMALDMYDKVSLMVSVQRHEVELWLGLGWRAYPLAAMDDYFRHLVIRCLDDYGSVESTSFYVKESRLFHEALANERQELEQGMDQRLQEVRKEFLQLGLPHDYVARINDHYRFGKIIEVFLRYKKFFRFLIPDIVGRLVRNYVAGQDGQGLEKVRKIRKLRQLQLIWGVVLEDIEVEMKLAEFVRDPTIKLLRYCFCYNDDVISFPDGTRLDTEMFRAKLRIYLETIVLAQSNNVFVFHTNPKIDNCCSFPHDLRLDSKEAVAREMNVSENLLVWLNPKNEYGMRFFAIFDHE
jgi:hypothetical protein